MNFVVSVIHAVAQLEQATAFFIQILGFQERECGEDGVIVENGALSVRLVATDATRICHSLELEISTPNIQQAASELLQQQNITVLTEPTWISPEHEEMRLQAPHDIVIALSRIYDEDELGILRELPISLDWDEDTESLVKRLLRLVPVTFRGSARQRVTQRIEMLSIHAGNVTVDRDTALRGLVQTTPDFQYQRLREELRQEGIDPEPLFAELDAS